MDTNKAYQKINIWQGTYQKFRQRHKTLNDDLKVMGIRKRNIPFTRFMDLVSKQGIVNLDKYDLKRIARRKNETQ